MMFLFLPSYLLMEKELRGSVKEIRKTESEITSVIRQKDIEVKNISIRLLETYNENEVAYSGRVESPHLVLSYLFSGSIRLEYEDGVNAGLHSNHQYTYFLPGNDYRLIYPAKTLISWIRVVIDMEFINDLIGRVFQLENWLLDYIENRQRFIDRKGMPLHPRVHQCLMELCRPPVDGPGREVYIAAKTMELISYNLSYDHTRDLIQVKGIAYKDLNAFIQLKDYLDYNYLASHSLKTLARDFGLNEFKLKKGFKALFGQTVFGYINSLKMQQGAMLLEKGLSVNEVADALGYTYPQHFSTAFKRHYEMSPRAFLKKRELGKVDELNRNFLH